ncbi:helix-turn-helix domain-containing protein [Microbacterium sp. CIAB417]|uniref:helix-turn-helix domain-containing protein n=1 Tax=Microbacterium sp. CIAB417 TaxID=2860287 RepID=UPI001FAC393F|nr:AraC family transcriptional regulator [Microbacterium sp. CIAB417]
MTTVDPALLEEVLSSFEVRLGFARRTTLSQGGLLPLAAGVVTLAYVVEGEITGEVMRDAGCTLDFPGGEASRTSGPRTLLAGDAFLTMGRGPVVLESTSGARLMTAELDLERSAVDDLPGFVFVTGFAELEPAAAALASNLGPVDPAPHDLRSGDPLICRMMVTTVLLSLIRAWAQAGCAPQGWPARAGDPFLDRVVEAIHSEPGRDWTVDLLATVGAMSRSVFAERFRAAVGQSPASYVTEVRMRQAKQMLDAGRSVSETSRELGYSSDEGFSRAFRRHTGVTPSMWRASRRSAIPA